jgi:capsular exopolysaccharide synthesis family protein
MDNRVAVPNKVGDYLKVELDRLQDKVRQANDAVERYRNQAQLQQGIFQSREAPLNTTALSQANSDLVAVRVKLQEANARLNEIRNNPDAFSDVIANPGIQQLRHQLSLVKENRSQLLATYGRANPAVRQVEASVADVERRLNVEIGRVVRSFASDVVVLTEREAKLVKTVDALKAEIQKAGNSRVVLASLEQEAEVNRTILTTFLTQYNQLTSQRALQVSDSFVLTKADVPTDPSFPPVVPFLGLAALMSVALSTGLALLLERTGHTIRSSQEVQPLLTSRLLGVIPNLVNRNAVLTQVIDRPQSAFTEAIRTILSGILPARDQGRSVLVASAQPSEGRTSIAVALARLAALSGRRVILIDCDVRRPGLHDAFGSERGPGVTDVLRGEVTLEEAIRRDTLSPLHYLTGGDFAPSAANLLYLPEMSGLLDRLRSEYDLLILDSPPSACVADAGFLAQMADETLFVVSWNRTPWRLVRQQIAEFSRYNLDVAGVVLNQVDMRLHSRQSPAYLATYRARAMLEAAE